MARTPRTIDEDRHRSLIEQHRIEPSDAIETFSALLLQNDVNAATLSLAQKLAGAARQPNMPAALQVLLQTPQYQLA